MASSRALDIQEGIPLSRCVSKESMKRLKARYLRNAGFNVFITMLQPDAVEICLDRQAAVVGPILKVMDLCVDKKALKCTFLISYL